jgi:hypothetical protein
MEKILSRAKINHNTIDGARVDLVLKASPDEDRYTWFSDYNGEIEDTEIGGLTIGLAKSAAARAWGADCWNLEWVDEPNQPETVNDKKYYVISRENVSPNAEPLNKIVIIQDHPGTTNQSHEEKISGWLGTTNDCYESAHGEFASLAAAQKYVTENWTDFLPLEEYDLESGEIEAYQDTREVWAIDDYLSDYARENISASTTDDEIKKMAAEVETEAKKNSVYIDGDVEDFLSGTRKELISDESTELEKLPQDFECQEPVIDDSVQITCHFCGRIMAKDETGCNCRYEDSNT